MRYLLVILNCCLFLPVLGQYKTDTTFVEKAIDRTIAFYEASIGKQSLLYNGRAYEEPPQTNDDHPFFEDYDWIIGSVDYNNNHFDSIFLLFDLTTHQLITESLQKHMLALISQRVDRFTIGNHKFIRLSSDSTFTGLTKEGFYELLYEGPTKVAVFHDKIVSRKLQESVEEIYYTKRSRYYIIREKSITEIKSKASVLQVFRDDDQAIKKYISKNRLKFKKSSGDDLISVVKFFDSRKSGVQQ